MPCQRRRGDLEHCLEAVVLSLALGDVPGDLGKPEELAGMVANCRDDDVGPEARAVLADAPALFLIAADFRRRCELPRRLPRGHVGLRVKGREVAAHYFVRLVAFEARPTAAPCADPPLAVEHQHGRVANTVPN